MRVAASTYLNSAPLVDWFARRGREAGYAYLGDEAPSRCAAMLAAGQCEAALIPVIEYQRMPGVRILPEMAVASKRRVRSVLIAARKPLDEVRTLALDTSSRSSQGLVRILFAERYGRLPAFQERTPDAQSGCENMLESSDAALVIGDPAMRLAAEADRLGVRIYDLAAEWREMTGLPFVFAVWAAREDVCEAGGLRVRDFLEAKADGLARVEEIAAQYARELRLPFDELLEYLRENISYDLDDENLEGMRTYFALAHRHGLIPENRALQFVRREDARARSGVRP